jgi:hypothetical protein
MQAYPMEKEKDAHNELSLFFKRERVPNIMVMDGAKSQVKGQFRSKCR